MSSADSARSSQCFNCTMKVAALGRTSDESVSNPIIATTFLTAGSFWISTRISSAIFSVRGKALPSGRLTATRTIPWSSFGMKEVGVAWRSCQPAAVTTTRIAAEMTRCFRAARTTWRKYIVKRASVWLNQTKKRFFFSSSWGFRRMAQRAGVKVSATKPEIATETATVTANCR